MTKICTDLQQSKRLVELGIDVNTADMCWCIRKLQWGEINKTIIAYPMLPNQEKSEDFKYIPAWSLSALTNLLPSEFTEVGKYSTTTYEIHIRKYKFTDEVDLYQIAYGNHKFYEDGYSSWKDMINTGEKENLIDSVYQMICWLKENEKI